MTDLEAAGSAWLEEVRPGVYAWVQPDGSWWLNNAGAVAGGDGLLVIEPDITVGSSLTVQSATAGWISSIGQAGEGVLDEHRRYYRFVLALADKGMASGGTPLAVARDAELGEFSDWPDAERLVLNLHRAYADAASRELDVAAAFADTVAWLGGPMHTSV